MFILGFLKTAKYDEQAEYEKANEVDRHMSKLPSPTPDKALKPGTRVAYHSADRGWKEGPWAHHTKGCSKDEEIDEQREKWQKAELKKHKIPDDFKKIKGAGQKEKQEIFRQVTDAARKKFPMHHVHAGKDWGKHAVGIGDMGTVMKVEKEGVPRYHITWDKHPTCTWGSYDSNRLKTLPAGMETLYPAPNIEVNTSGSEKVAAEGKPILGARGGARPIYKPSRVTSDIGTYGAPKGASSVTGVSVKKPFTSGVASFGTKPRLGLQSFTRLKGR